MQRGGWRPWQGVYLASWNMGPAMLLGCAGLPWARWLARRERPLGQRLALHAMAALVFIAGWQAIDFLMSVYFYGTEHAVAMVERMLLWQAMWGVFVYVALMLGFGGALHARRAHQSALSAALAEAALVRAELAAINGKLNPHFLFNTLNSLMMLTRRDPAAAEQTLLRFSRLMRYVLDTLRGSTDRVTLQEELDFVRDYLELEALRLGPRLAVDWAVEDAALDVGAGIDAERVAAGRQALEHLEVLPLDVLGEDAAFGADATRKAADVVARAGADGLRAGSVVGGDDDHRVTRTHREDLGATVHADGPERGALLEDHRAGARLHDAVEEIEQRRLAGAVRPDQREHLAALHVMQKNLGNLLLRLRERGKRTMQLGQGRGFGLLVTALQDFQKLGKARIHVIGVYPAGVDFSDVAVNLERNTFAVTLTAPAAAQLLVALEQCQILMLVQV